MKLHASISCAAIMGMVFSVGAHATTGRDMFLKNMSGVQFGAGIPLVTPLTGYNVFVGYVNKNASTFLGRRFGVRADFNIPTNLQINASLNDNGDGYDVDLDGKVLGFKIKSSDFTDEKITVDSFEDDAEQPIVINGLTAGLELKNKSMGVLVDFYPFGNTWFLGGIRFSGGYYTGEFGINASVNMPNDIGFRYAVGNNNDYIYAQIDGGSKFGIDYSSKYSGPYAGFGFDLGIFRGFKFYMDAGVVFANNIKHLDNNNFKDNDLSISGRYIINERANGSIFNQVGVSTPVANVQILNGMSQEPQVNDIVSEIVGNAAHQLIHNNPTYANMASNFSGVSAEQMGKDVLNYLNNGTEAPWVNRLLTTTPPISGNDTANYSNSDLAKTLDDIKREWKKNNEQLSGIQEDIHQIWVDYDDAKQDAIREVNDFLDKYGMIPMIKLGFMYRF